MSAYRLWRGLWDGGGCWAEDASFHPHDHNGLIAGGEAIRRYWSHRRSVARLIDDDWREIARWNLDQASLTVAQLLLVTEEMGERLARPLRLSLCCLGDTVLHLSEAPPAVMVRLNQSYMDEAVR